MISYNKKSNGELLRVNFGRDISTATSFSMILEPNVGEKLEVTPVLGAADVDVGDEEFLADQYVEYSTTADMFLYAGRWRAKAVATLPAEVVATNYVFFRVME